MLVYGDAVRRLPPATMLREIRTWMSGDCGSPIGIVRHAAIVAALVEAGELAQGIADAEFEARGGRDGSSAASDAAMALTVELARCVGESWSSAYAPIAALPWQALAAIEGARLPGLVAAKLPEGFAHYGLYPEAYWAAAQSLGFRNLRVVGIRSIGTTFAAVVAAATASPAPITLRPVGHPFGRELAPDGDLAQSIAGGQGLEHAIVDEGPGLSGSSMACVAERLEAEGIPSCAIHLFPSHRNGPGAKASENVRARWSRLPSHVVTFDDLVLDAPDPRHRLDAWVRDLVGDAEAPPRDVSGGAWRLLRCIADAHWPPVCAWQERRKFLLSTASGTWLLKFAGLGRIGAAKHERARRLAAAGFVPEVAGLRHGFLVERWRDDAAPIGPGTPDRPALLRRLAEYLAFRAREFRSEAGRGASLAELFGMAAHNAAEALGREAGRRVADMLPDAAELERFVRPIETDNRLQAWEWLHTPDGLLKADALDHHAGHDLVGDQDVAWDVAGAAVEFAMTPSETGRLAAEIERLGGGTVSGELVQALTVCYRTFQLGRCWMAAASAGDAAESERLRSAASRYAAGIKADPACRPAPGAA